MSIKLLYPVALAVVVACASTGGAAGKPVLPRSSNLLSAAQIAEAHADAQTAYDAIARLRPNWLAPHGVTSTQANGAGTEYATVFIDGQAYGDLSTLRRIPAYTVGGIRYYNVSEAGGRFGIRGGASGVIEVTTKSPARQ